MMLAFDMPIPFNSVGRRNVSNVPSQALILMNDPFVVEQSKLWGKRIAGLEDKRMEDKILQMYIEAFARFPLKKKSLTPLSSCNFRGRNIAFPKKIWIRMNACGQI